MAAVLLVSATAFAGHRPAEVASYTGCLKQNGKVEDVAPGDQPGKPCNGSETEIHLSGGDITAVAPGFGLDGGADQGTATLSVDPAAVQARVTGNCLSGDASITAIDPDGTVTCNPDDDTTYSPGTGLDLAGTQFRVAPDYRLPQGCSAGHLPKWNGSTWECADDQAGEEPFVATLNAGTLVAEGSHDDSLCDEGNNEGGAAGPHTSTAGPVELPEGEYLVVPTGLSWEINKVSGYWDDADVFYAGEVSAKVGTTALRREVNSRGLIVHGDRDFGLIHVGPNGASVTLEIQAYAWACSHARIGGSIQIVRVA